MTLIYFLHSDMEAGRSLLELKSAETEIKFLLWSCLSYMFSVEDDGGNTRNEMFFDAKHSVAQFLSLFKKYPSCTSTSLPSCD